MTIFEDLNLVPACGFPAKSYSNVLIDSGIPFFSFVSEYILDYFLRNEDKKVLLVGDGLNLGYTLDCIKDRVEFTKGHTNISNYDYLYIDVKYRKIFDTLELEDNLCDMRYEWLLTEIIRVSKFNDSSYDLILVIDNIAANVFLSEVNEMLRNTAQRLYGSIIAPIILVNPVNSNSIETTSVSCGRESDITICVKKASTNHKDTLLMFKTTKSRYEDCRSVALELK